MAWWYIAYWMRSILAAATVGLEPGTWFVALAAVIAQVVRALRPAGFEPASWAREDDHPLAATVLSALIAQLVRAFG